MPTLSQIKTIQAGRHTVGMDDGEYRLMLWNVAHVRSTKDLDNAGYEDCMAILEAKGFDSHPSGPTYWQDRSFSRKRSANPRMLHMIQALIAETRYELAGMVERMSAGRTRDAAALTPHEAWNLIEALKAIAEREDAPAVAARE